MENPVKAVTSKLTVANIVMFLVVGGAIFAVADLLGYTSFIITPVSAFKKLFSKSSGS